MTTRRFYNEYDNFTGDQIGSYTTREGKPGLVLQQVGTKVVHVYGEHRLVEVDLAAEPVYPSATIAESNRWPDPLESPQAEAIRNGKVDQTEILSMFDKMERELVQHRLASIEHEAARTAAENKLAEVLNGASASVSSENATKRQRPRLLCGRCGEDIGSETEWQARIAELEAALVAIENLATPSANATVRKMAAVSRAALAGARHD